MLMQISFFRNFYQNLLSPEKTILSILASLKMCIIYGHQVLKQSNNISKHISDRPRTSCVGI